MDQLHSTEGCLIFTLLTGYENYHLITFFGLMFYFLVFLFLAGFRWSSILGGLDVKYVDKLNSFLAPVLRSSSRSRFVRCWRAKTDGWEASTFHSNCDGKGPTVVIIQVGSYIFGGYTDLSWSGKYHVISRADFFQFVSLLMVNTCFAISICYILLPQCSNPVQLAFTSNHK